MQHLPDLISEFSVLKFTSTLRLERLNQLNKSHTKESHNYSSLGKQVIKKWALNFLQNSFVLKKEIDYGRFYSTKEFGLYFSDDLIRFVNPLKDLSILRKYELENGTVVEEGSTFLIDYNQPNSHLPKFLKIDFILSQEDENIKFICKSINTLGFLKEIHCFKVKTDNNYYQINENEMHIKLFKKLSHISCSGIEVINKNFYVPYRFGKNYL